jgi:dihydroxyacetone kinase
MADGVAVGNVFASPAPAPILEVTKAIRELGLFSFMEIMLDM